MVKLNTSPLGGTRDFLPLDVLRRKYVVDVVETVYQRYGFEPLETPAMERLETLLGKYGEEGDQLIFRVMKRGEKLSRSLGSSPTEDSLADSGLRYDLTVPLARVAAEYRNELPRIFKRYQIQPVYRADRPAKGRFREFYQCDLDIVGSESRLVEVEVLNAAADVLKSLRFEVKDFKLRLNHRVLLSAIVRSAGLPFEQEETTLVAIDKLDKIGLDGVRTELLRRGVGTEVTDDLLAMLSGVPASNERILSWLTEKLRNSSEGLRSLEELALILRYVEEGPANNCVRLDPFLARGLSYYTGPIFEVEFAGVSGSAGGGGRYDELIGMFSGRPIPACGFSLGLERILLILQENKLFPERLAGRPEVLVTVFGDATIAASLRVVHELRQAGLHADLFPETGKYGKQFKYAAQRNIVYAVILSPKEVERGIAVVRDLRMGKQWELKAGELARWLCERLEKFQLTEDA